MNITQIPRRCARSMDIHRSFSTPKNVYILGTLLARKQEYLGMLHSTARKGSRMAVHKMRKYSERSKGELKICLYVITVYCCTPTREKRGGISK